MNYIARICLGLIAALGINSAIAEPVVPGFDVEVYAVVPGPMKLTFDPSGVLYVGVNADPGRIYRVGAGGSPVSEYGDTLLADPDAVAFDASGAISGTAGSVLVGGFPGHISAILPDETTIELFAPGSVPDLGNPQTLKFDQTGRLIISDVSSTRILASTGGAPFTLTTDGTDGLAIDPANRIFSQNEFVGLQIVLPDGSMSTPLSSFDDRITGLAFGSYDSVWDGDLIAMAGFAELYRVDNKGQFEQIGSGFSGGTDVVFGPDGALYISAGGANAIYRVTPTEIIIVSIDAQNRVNLDKDSGVSAAILTDDNFDALQVDLSTVRFGPDEAEVWRYRTEDFDGDGDIDLRVRFKLDETGIACGDTEVTLTGSTFDDLQFTGTDSIKVICN